MFSHARSPIPSDWSAFGNRALTVRLGLGLRPHPTGSVLPTSTFGKGLASLLRLVLSASAYWILQGSVPANADTPLVLADPSLPLASAWEHRSFGESTDYSAGVVDGVAAIRAEGRISACGLYRRVQYSVRDHPWLEWSWRVGPWPNSISSPAISNENTSVLRLGLPLTKSLVELHGGSLDLQSEVGIGTTVKVRFLAERIVSEAATGT